jgi:hypothetical protein
MLESGGDGMSHTKGKVELDHFAMVNITQNKNYIVTKEEHNDNARRLAALWNAAEELGLATEKIAEGEIQRTFTLAESRAGVIEAALERIEKLEAEKAEMLAILEELRESSTCCGTYDLLDETTWASPDLADRIESAIRKARGEE